MPERIQSSGTYTNRLNVSNISRTNDPETPTNQTFDFQKQKNKVDLYDELLRKHLGKTATAGLNPFKSAGQEKVSRISSAIQKEAYDKLLTSKTPVSKRVIIHISFS